MGNGRDAALATMRTINQLSSDASFEILDVIATEDSVAIRSRASGTDDGPGWGAVMGAPATGRSFSVEGIDVVKVGPDGRYTEHYGIVDVPAMMMQLGLMPGAPPSE
jgi:predicted ester cyclase